MNRVSCAGPTVSYFAFSVPLQCCSISSICKFTAMSSAAAAARLVLLTCLIAAVVLGSPFPDTDPYLQHSVLEPLVNSTSAPATTVKSGYDYRSGAARGGRK
ncbi:unnamed protein product [Lymnaea stagnalis]|uniref:Uncharacterized protein n=1 Tax=Lymnaea stagnalis TaxID=6523 RepID=A0AAV2HW55_LYMST